MNGLSLPTNGTGAAPVLVVEDESMIRMLLVWELEDAGLMVLEADGADAAVVALEANPLIALVVTDIRMPGSMDGLGLASWMHSNAPGCPIIITSGFASPPDFATINPAIACAWSKPYLAKDLAGCVVNIMAQYPPST